jgi:hypothetical protein
MVPSPPTEEAASPRSLEALERRLRPLRSALVRHPVHAHLTTLNDVRCFMEHHVFAVWDFMSRVKSLQQRLTCTAVPWVPRGDAVARRLMNEIVLGEESDEASMAEGGYASHFDLYRASMRACGARTASIDAFIERVAAGGPVAASLRAVNAPGPSQDFVHRTFDILATDSLPRIAAAFTLGREDIIPDMFVRLVAGLSAEHGGVLSGFHDYLERHIRLDGERHGPMAARLLSSICGDDATAWEEASRGAALALEARLALWDGVVAAVEARAG